MLAEARDACGGEEFELQVGRGRRDEDGGKVVEVGDAELNMRRAMSIEGEMPAAWSIMMCMCVH